MGTTDRVLHTMCRTSVLRGDFVIMNSERSSNFGFFGVVFCVPGPVVNGHWVIFCDRHQINVINSGHERESF
jgi:hypothetical protein